MTFKDRLNEEPEVKSLKESLAELKKAWAEMVAKLRRRR